MIEENTFFREATLRICGSLEIENAMCSCVRYLQKFIPVEEMFLQVLEPEVGAMRTVATANATGGRKVNLLTQLSPELAERIRERIRTHGAIARGDRVTIETAESNPIAAEMLRYHGCEGWSVLLMRVATEGGHLGAVVLAADGENVYTTEHVRLLGLIEDPFTVALANTLVHREVVRLRDQLADDNRYLHREMMRMMGDEIVGADFGLREVMHKVRQVAPTESPVLLTGETGVGKDVVANAIHLGSPRRDGPFVAVNCGAIPESLIDSELFGHEKGAFTGALSKKRGRFERAGGGTILLDEIGEMPLEAQVRLLRVLQHRDIERVGGTDRIPVDIRIIAATNKELPAMVKAGQFREDLWFRLNVFPISVPPLRERVSDIPALVQHFIDRKAGELKIGDTPQLADGAIDRLVAYDWPGNVRELENVIERAMILHRGEALRFDNLGASLRSEAISPRESGEFVGLDTVVARHIRRALAKTDGKIHGPGGAGELLGINPNTLRYKMKKLGIPFKKRHAP